MEARRAERKAKRQQVERERKIQKLTERQALLEAGVVLDEKRKCSACGLPGHNRSSRDCPKYDENEEPLIDIEGLSPSINPDLVKVDGTKLRFPKQAISKDQKVVVKIKKEKLPDYAKKHLLDAGARRPQRKKKVGISRAQQALSSTLEEKVWKALRAHQWAHPFLVPVQEKIAPDYHKVVQHPMDLSTIRTVCMQWSYCAHLHLRG